MSFMNDEITVSGKETVIFQWKEKRKAIQWISAAAVVVALIVSLIADGKERVVLWCIITGAVLLLAACDCWLAHLVHCGEKEVYLNEIENIKTKNKLESLGVASFNSDLQREWLLLSPPSQITPYAIPLYAVLMSICVLGILISAIR